jgi:alkanesulfonate monooxygenase SsuD/methylene tetrahydromethanopterin reductase-like flavin-dependent oxidoreductase (luciferase family)
MARFIAIAPTAGEAEDTARRGARWLVGSYAKPAYQPRMGVTGNSPQPPDPAERYMKGVIVYGTPEAVVDELARLREEMMLEYLLCAPLSHQSFILFTEQVLPRIS